MGGLEQPRQMDQRVGATLGVRLDRRARYPPAPSEPWVPASSGAAGKAEHGGDVHILDEGFDHARADVARGACHDNVHLRGYAPQARPTAPGARPGKAGARPVVPPAADEGSSSTRLVPVETSRAVHFVA
jgi:hypothetical protein